MNPSGGVIAADSALHTWPELDRAALSLASALVEQGVRKGDRVAVLHPKSVWSFVAVHAVLRCGGVMVPLDPLGPSESVERVLDFCTPTALVGAAPTLRAKASGYLRAHDPVVIASGDDSDSALLDLSARSMTLTDALGASTRSLDEVRPDDLAYIIFTSGSTGEPKGIAHTHRSALAYVENAHLVHGLRTDDRIAGTSPLHFDMSTLELYVAPFAGATAVTITEGELRFPASLSRRLEDTGVTVIYAVPYQLRQLCLRGDVENRNLAAVRQVSFGGEQFAPGVLRSIADAIPTAELLNVYGPAEVNGIVSHHFTPESEEIDHVPIGRPWAKVLLRVVDDRGQAVVDREPGELLVSCPSQMLGYWGRSDLNDQCFETIDGVRWYRTGDIVSADPEGRLHFHGRADTRVKVRGVRLELEMIESVLCDMPGVGSAVVGVAELSGGLQEVVAWLLPTDKSEHLGPADVQRWCRERLSASAIPTDVRIVEHFAQSRTGKIDRRALRETLRPQTDSKG